MPLILGSVVGLIALLVIGALVMKSTADSRALEKRRRAEEADRLKREHEAKQAAVEAEAKRIADEAAAKKGPWAKALEKVVMPLKKYMEKENAVKRIIGSRGWENDRAEFHIRIRPKFYTEPMEDVQQTLDALCAKIVECAENGFAHAEKEGYPLSSEAKNIIIHFWDPPPEEPKAAEPEGDEGSGEGAAAPKKPKNWGKEVANYKNGTLTITGRR
jgi:hypothetical protein